MGGMLCKNSTLTLLSVGRTSVKCVSWPNKALILPASEVDRTATYYSREAERLIFDRSRYIQYGKHREGEAPAEPQTQRAASPENAAQADLCPPPVLFRVPLGQTRDTGWGKSCETGSECLAFGDRIPYPAEFFAGAGRIELK